MRKIIIFLTLLNIILFPNFLLSHVNHYGNLKFLEYEIYLNNELIGTHVFNFKTEKDIPLGIDLSGLSNYSFPVPINNFINKKLL